MPTRFIQRKPRPLLSVVNANTTAIGVDSDSDELKWAGASGVILVAPPGNKVSVQMTASSVDANAFIADANYQVVGVREVHSVAGAASSTVDVKKCTGTTAPASGTTILTAAIALDATANTVQTATLTSTVSTLQLAAGDRLALDFTGTLTGLVGVIDIFLKRIE